MKNQYIEIFHYISGGEDTLPPLEKHCFDMAMQNEYVKTTHEFIRYYNALLDAHRWGMAIDDEKNVVKERNLKPRSTLNGCRSYIHALALSKKLTEAGILPIKN
jgi:hypothetical protein